MYLSSLDLTTIYQAQENKPEGKLVLAYHTSVTQQRTIVWEQMVFPFLKIVWWVLLQSPFAENHEYKSQEDELSN